MCVCVRTAAAPPSDGAAVPRSSPAVPSASVAGEDAAATVVALRSSPDSTARAPSLPPAVLGAEPLLCETVTAVAVAAPTTASAAPTDRDYFEMDYTWPSTRGMTLVSDGGRFIIKVAAGSEAASAGIRDGDDIVLVVSVPSFFRCCCCCLVFAAVSCIGRVRLPE